MNREPFHTLKGTAVLLPFDNVDTDQIIPARFLKTTNKDGLAEQLFYDWRYHNDGSPKADFVLNRLESQGASFLVAGANFGSGSSREHAPWALHAWGFRAIVARSFADIFKSNALKNGVVPIEIDAGAHETLCQALAKDPRASMTVDIEAQRFTMPGGTSVSFPIDDFAKHCLLNGIDQLGYILSFEPAIQAYENA